MRYLVLAAVVLAACGRAGADKARAGTGGAGEAADAAPPSIMGLIVAEQIDSAIARVQPEERKVSPDAGGDVWQLTLWRIEGKPAKLVARAGDAGPQAQSVWYFSNGQVAQAQGPNVTYAFAGGKLVEWTNRSGVVVESDPAALRTREQELLTQADKWLKEFGP